MAVDGSIQTTMSGAMEALSGYLLLTLLTSTLPLISHHLAASGTHQNMTPKLLSAGRYDIYQPVECLMLYLAAYPLLSAYRSTEGWSAAMLCILLCVLLYWLQPKITSFQSSSAPKLDTEASIHGDSVGDAPHTRTQSCQDTSLLKEMDGDLIDSNLEPHYSNLIDSANAPIFGVDCVGRVNVWNRCAMRIVGYTPDEVMGKNLVREFITKDYQASVGMVIDQALRGDETANL